MLAARIESTTAPAGQAMFSYGDPGDALYIVRSSVVNLFAQRHG